ncbi:MAG: GNAT family N-acetyltransferase [Christensenellales bacterium]
MNFLDDINFNTDYLKGYEKIDGGKLETFRFTCDIGEVFVHYIKRPLDTFPGYEGYFDIITPYGYGGQMISGCEDDCEADLVSRFNDAFLQHCRQEKIVSYFVRFNPLVQNAAVFSDFFDELLPIRKVIAMDLTKNTVEEEITKKGLSEYRTALARGTQVTTCSAKDAMDGFISMYYETMRNKKAMDYYFFPREYFEHLFHTFPENTFLFIACADNTPIAYTLSIEYGDVSYCHLTCRKEECNYYKASYAANIRAAEHAKSRGCKYFVLGGGLSSAEDDSLYRFKKNFSVSAPHTFHIGKKIFDLPVYNSLCGYVEKMHGTDLSQDFFPKYRCPRA